MAKRALLFVEQHGGSGGGQRVIASLASSEEIRRRWDVTVAMPERGEAWDRLRAAGVRVVQSPSVNVRNGPKEMVDLARFVAGFPGQVRWFKALLREVEPEFVYTSSPRYLLQLLVARRGTRTRIAFHLQHFYRRPLYERFLALALSRRAVALVVCASSAAERWVHTAVRSAAPVIVVPSWLTELGRGESAEGVRPGSGVVLPAVSPGSFRFGLVGRLVRLKGQDVFLEAAARLLQSDADAEFYLIGGVVYAESGGYAQRLVEEYGDQPRVHFVGHIARMADVYPQLACVVVPSRSEMFPLVVVEAMYYGVPVIVADIEDLPRIVDFGRCGLVFKGESVDDLAAAMRRVMADTALRARLREAGRRRARQEYLPERCIPRIVEALEASAGSAALPDGQVHQGGRE